MDQQQQEPQLQPQPQQEISGEEYRRMSVSSRQPSTSHKRTVTIPVVWIVTIIVVGGLAFFGGVHYEKNHLPQTTAANAAAADRTAGGFGGAKKNDNRVFGTVTAVTSSSITVDNVRTGSSATYAITSSTQITDNGQSVTYTDIQTGDTVAITKSSSTSSDVTAIDVNPSFGGGFGAQQGTTGGSDQSSGDSASDD